MSDAPAISPQVVILTREELQRRERDAFRRGLEQGIREATTPQSCHAARDGDCIWPLCPQLRDGEPVKTGRHCPLDTHGDEEA